MNTQFRFPTTALDRVFYREYDFPQLSVAHDEINEINQNFESIRRIFSSLENANAILDADSDSEIDEDLKSVLIDFFKQRNT